MEENILKVGDEVYVKATVDKMPGEFRKLYRLVMPDGTVIWTKPDEIVIRRTK